jgi:hypothetical protein
MEPSLVIRILRQCADNIEVHQSHSSVHTIIRHELIHLEVYLKPVWDNLVATDLPMNSVLGLPTVKDNVVQFNQPFKKGGGE